MTSEPTSADSTAARFSPESGPDSWAGPLWQNPCVVTAAVLGIVLAGLWTWWGLESGGFFAPVEYGGAILLFVTVVVVLVAAPLRISLSKPRLLALFGLFGLFLWTLLSLIWTPTRDLAVEDSAKVLIYATSLLAGLILGDLCRRRILLAAIPFCLAGAIVAVVTLVAVLGVDASETLLDESGTLDYPLGYRNANAAYFIVVALVLAGIGSARSLPVVVRPAAVGGAALCAQLAVLSQSRGSVIAAAAALVVLVAVSRDRARVIAVLVSIAAPVAVAMPSLLDPFAVADDGAGAAGVLRDAGEAALLAAAVAAVTGFAALSALDWLRLRLARRPRRPRLRAALAAAVVVVGVAAAIAAVGNPVSWLEDQASARFSDDPGSSSRFAYTGGLSRSDYWRVSLDAATDSPVIGQGSGSFRKFYALDRDATSLPLDAHNLPIEVLAELGGIGLALLLAVAVGVVWALAQSRRAGRGSATISAAAAAAGAYYAAHASIDWLWSFPGLTAPVIALLGVAAAPSREAVPPLPRRIAMPLAAGLAACALVLVPLLISEQLTADGAAAPDARDRLERAASLNPFADLPYLIAADLARREGDVPAALAYLRKARERDPDEWLNYTLAARALLPSDPRRAREELRRAARLYPTSSLSPANDEIGELRERIRQRLSSGPDAGR